MAYKNQKKNKRHLRTLKLKDGRIRKKHAREKDRNHPPEKVTLESLEQIMREQGMI